MHLGKQLKVGPVANCPSPPGAFLLSFDTLMFNLLVLMPLLGSVVYRLVQCPKLEMFFSEPGQRGWLPIWGQMVFSPGSAMAASEDKLGSKLLKVCTLFI